MKINFENVQSRERLDKYLAKNSPYSRSQIKKNIEKGNICVNASEVKASYKLLPGDKIQGNIIEDGYNLDPVKMDLDIIYEDEDILVINKAYDLAVHPAKSIKEPSLVNGLLAYTNNLSNLAGDERRGIVHRLDKDTTGVILVAKNNTSHQKLKEYFKKRIPEKYYLAIVHGKVDQEGKVDIAIERDSHNRTRMTTNKEGEKRALSFYKPIDANENYSLVLVKIITGRTHQVRVHMAHIGHQILGDRVYGRKKEKINTDRQMLHALAIKIPHPISNKDMTFTADLDDSFRDALEKTNLRYKDEKIDW